MDFMVEWCGIHVKCYGFHSRCVWNPWGSVWNPWSNVWNETIPPEIHLKCGSRVNYWDYALFIVLHDTTALASHVNKNERDIANCKCLLWFVFYLSNGQERHRCYMWKSNFDKIIALPSLKKIIHNSDYITALVVDVKPKKAKESQQSSGWQLLFYQPQIVAECLVM